MLNFKSFRKQLYKIKNENFEELVFKAFNYQSTNNEVYSQYLKSLNIKPQNIKDITKIPFLPISFFKNHKVTSGQWNIQEVFESSGTTSTTTSKHYVDDLNFYLKHSLKNFELFYGLPSEYHILALLPSYLERENSSLVHMVQHIIENSGSSYSGFYLYNYDDFLLKMREINDSKADNRKILVIGISFALLDVEIHKVLPLSKELIVIETGGMKGRRKEMIRKELHSTLKNRWQTEGVHSEYGMTELFSQAYSMGDGQFQTPPWMRVMVREINDPFSYTRGIGGINVIDLANIHSCVFIETQDIGQMDEKGNFEVMGRFDNSDIRGCNLLLN